MRACRRRRQFAGHERGRCRTCARSWLGRRVRAPGRESVVSGERRQV